MQRAKEKMAVLDAAQAQALALDDPCTAVGPLCGPHYECVSDALAGVATCECKSLWTGRGFLWEEAGPSCHNSVLMERLLMAVVLASILRLYVHLVCSLTTDVRAFSVLKHARKAHAIAAGISTDEEDGRRERKPSACMSFFLDLVAFGFSQRLVRATSKRKRVARRFRVMALALPTQLVLLLVLMSGAAPVGVGRWTTQLFVAAQLVMDATVLPARHETFVGLVEASELAPGRKTQLRRQSFAVLSAVFSLRVAALLLLEVLATDQARPVLVGMYNGAVLAASFVYARYMHLLAKLSDGIVESISDLEVAIPRKQSGMRLGRTSISVSQQRSSSNALQMKLSRQSSKRVSLSSSTAYSKSIKSGPSDMQPYPDLGGKVTSLLSESQQKHLRKVAQNARAMSYQSVLIGVIAGVFIPSAFVRWQSAPFLCIWAISNFGPGHLVFSWSSSVTRRSWVPWLWCFQPDQISRSSSFRASHVVPGRGAPHRHPARRTHGTGGKTSHIILTHFSTFRAHATTLARSAMHRSEVTIVVPDNEN